MNTEEKKKYMERKIEMDKKVREINAGTEYFLDFEFMILPFLNEEEIIKMVDELYEEYMLTGDISEGFKKYKHEIHKGIPITESFPGALTEPPKFSSTRYILDQIKINLLKNENTKEEK